MITAPISAERGEDLRREIAAMLFFSLPPKDAPEREKFDRLVHPVRGLLHLLDIIEGRSDRDDPQCEGCGRLLTPETPRLVCEDGPELCSECAPEEHPATQFGYRAEDADQDIERARQWARDLMQDDEDAA